MHQYLFGAVEQRVEACRQDQVVEAGNRTLVTDLAAKLARAVGRLVEQIAGGIDRRVLKSAEHAAAVHIVCAAVEALQHEGAAGEIGIDQRCGEELRLVGRRVAGRHPANAARRDPGRAVTRHGHIVRVALQLEPVGDHFQPCAGGQLVAQAREDGPAIAILNVALRPVDTDPVVVPVEEGATLFVGGPDTGIERPGPIAYQSPGLRTDTFAFEAGRQRHLRQRAERNPVLSRCANRHLIDHAAGRTDPLQRVRAVDHLDPVDEERIDRVAVARAVPHRGRLGNAVDRVERSATAKALPRPGQLLASGRKGRQQCRYRVDGGAGDLHLPLQRLAVDDVDGQRQRTRRKLGASCGDDNRALLIRVGRGVIGRRDVLRQRDGRKRCQRERADEVAVHERLREGSRARSAHAFNSQ